MKIGILTFFNYNNYGAALQCYGLYQTLTDMGHEVEYLDYTCPYIGNPFKLIHLRNKGIFGYIYSAVGYICYLPRRRRFQEFRSRIAHTAPLNEKTIENVAEKYDRFIVGSDQVWSTRLTNYDKHFFLDFVKDPAKKYSYAASFGENSDIVKRHGAEAGRLLGEFQGLSVREDYGQELIGQLTGRDSEITVDPTLLLSAREWSRVSSHKRVKGKYLLVYQLGFSKELIQTVQAVKKATGLQVIYIPFPLGGAVPCKISISIGPAEWLSLLKNAEYVITDSYHGIIFSILFRRQFLAVVGGQHKNQRAISLLEKLKLTDWIVKENNFDQIFHAIDYDEVEPTLRQEAETSREWLRRNFQEQI